MKINPSRRLASYLSAGVCVAVTEARAEIVVTFFPDPVDYPTGFTFSPGSPEVSSVGEPYPLAFAYTADLRYWSQGSDLVNDPSSVHGSGSWGDSGYGASFDVGVFNYASISFRDDDGILDAVFEAVGKFDLSSPGNGSLVAIVKDTDGFALSISDGKIHIDAAAVPEPSGLLLGLLALGAAGCRRRRNAVPPRQVS